MTEIVFEVGSPSLQAAYKYRGTVEGVVDLAGSGFGGMHLAAFHGFRPGCFQGCPVTLQCLLESNPFTMKRVCWAKTGENRERRKMAYGGLGVPMTGLPPPYPCVLSAFGSLQQAVGRIPSVGYPVVGCTLLKSSSQSGARSWKSPS